MDLLQMRYVTTIAGLKSMTKAAETLHVSQSALSLSCKRLEEELGVKLFARDGRNLKLTEVGNAFCERARIILSLSDDLAEYMNQLGTRGCNTVFFGSEVIDFSNELIALYRQFSPSMDVLADNTTKHGILDKLYSREYDFALTLDDLTGDAIESTLIVDEPMLVVVGPTSHLVHQTRLTMHQLDGASLVTTSEDYSIGVLMRSFFSQTGTNYRRIHQVGDSDSITIKVYNNFGISFVPECVVNLWIKTPQIRIQGNFWIPIEDSCCRRKIYLTRLRDAKPGSACTAFLKFLNSYSAAVRNTHAYPTHNELLPYL